MRKSILFLLLIWSIDGTLIAQQSNGRPPQGETVTAEETRRMIRQRQETDRRFEALRSTGEYSRNSRGLQRSIALQNLSNMYRKPTREELKTIAGNKDDLKQYAQFLRQSGSGLTKLIVDKGCADYTDVLNVSDECLKYTMPGGGSSFSFRTGNYRIRRLSDLTYTGDSFYSPGILTHSLIVNIGDRPLEQVTNQTPGLAFLGNFQTVTDFAKAVETDKQLSAGITNNGYFYSRKAAIEENSTYVLRVIAYRGNHYRAVHGYVYDELDLDERRDVTIAFRIIRRDEQSVTILWKILSNQKAPVIKKPDQDFLKTEENKFMADTKTANEN